MYLWRVWDQNVVIFFLSRARISWLAEYNRIFFKATLTLA